MHHATTIYLYGTGRAQMNVAEEAQRILLTMHKILYCYMMFMN